MQIRRNNEPHRLYRDLEYKVRSKCENWVGGQHKRSQNKECLKEYSRADQVEGGRKEHQGKGGRQKIRWQKTQEG